MRMRKLLMGLLITVGLYGCSALDVISKVIPSGQSGGVAVDTEVEVSKGKTEAGIQSIQKAERIVNTGIHPGWFVGGMMGLMGLTYLIGLQKPRPNWSLRREATRIGDDV